MKPQRSARLSYEESCRQLQAAGIMEEGATPPLPDRQPQFDDDDISSGLRLFRGWLGSGQPFGLSIPPDFENTIKETDCENLTLPHTFFGRSEISRISFKNTDLCESTLCWNDFIQVNFTDADLSGSDLRASLFKHVRFVRANLRNADLRRSTFKDCDFAEADLSGAKLSQEQAGLLPLTERQTQAINWQQSAGEEPPGG